MQGPASLFAWATSLFPRSNASPPLAGTAASSLPTTPSQLHDRSAVPTPAIPTHVSTPLRTYVTGHTEVRAPRVSTPTDGAASSAHADPSVVASPNETGSCQENQPDPWEVPNGFATKEEGRQYVASWSADQGFVSNIVESKVNMRFISLWARILQLAMFSGLM